MKFSVNRKRKMFCQKKKRREEQPEPAQPKPSQPGIVLAPRPSKQPTRALPSPLSLTCGTYPSAPSPTAAGARPTPVDLLLFNSHSCEYKRPRHRAPLIPHSLLSLLPQTQELGSHQAARTRPRSSAIAAGRKLAFRSPSSTPCPLSFPFLHLFPLRIFLTRCGIFLSLRSTSPSTTTFGHRLRQLRRGIPTAPELLVVVFHATEPVSSSSLQRYRKPPP